MSLMQDAVAPRAARSGPVGVDRPLAKNHRKIRGRALLRSFLGRALHPQHLWRAFRLHRGRKAHQRVDDDAQLALYAQILPSDFLHYGYFSDPGRMPEDIALSELAHAQTRYAELLLELACDNELPALDIGCGMGGLSRMLRDRGYKVTALTPDRLQAAHVRAELPDVEVIHSKFEQLDAAAHEHQYGTVFTSESLQYLKLDQALPILDKIVAPGGRWVACDFFQRQLCEERGGHLWETFAAQVERHGWRIASQRDITPHILPTLRYVHMWAHRFGVPLMHFGFLRLRRKQPALHHLLEPTLDSLEAVAANNLRLIDPIRFAEHKRYLLLTLERA